MESTLMTRQNWMSILAHSQPTELLTHWQPLNLSPEYQVIRAPEIGLNQLQARMGATGRRFILGDMTVTRAVIKLNDCTDIYGYSYIAGRNKPHAELCALLDALLQYSTLKGRPAGLNELLLKTVIHPLAAIQQKRRQLRAQNIAASKVDFFTLVRGED
ncbi:MULTISPECIES: phosphonate C-P lyase system protein PhnG [Yersinia pseudotuberculosis complex]|uniref:Phosphonate metabolism protein PhnG n=1 Tax=Yersinia pseudotuberculosis serotype O:1b (strain IP 31758) TaxID=349747 RepID=A0A0U1QUQ9_YERP3|nr:MULTISPECIES: phosphonate C-P lyase system protein PhnG [Yersinia pseudotuberculosis complex]ABS46192.1 phosphonate metabolism protein PhnG [Yersinia pseudotuberculosis IP 31758]AJK15085.1 phosphonate C-P lyase system protein PhnG [Yersinia pseudotuberculosis str. PA3606]MCE4112839.1 phosphonate C-P lyase system protein PhnG [Yersinia pseudotuberculosis]MCF1161467.1 phosphonate C-P lyase system protein PhnG [Yersinia pseudotuberculosis]RYC25962.1 phosphonate C-P lyase system protein PhnG [Y